MKAITATRSNRATMPPTIPPINAMLSLDASVEVSGRATNELDVDPAIVVLELDRGVFWIVGPVNDADVLIVDDESFVSLGNPVVGMVVDETVVIVIGGVLIDVLVEELVVVGQFRIAQLQLAGDVVQSCDEYCQFEFGKTMSAHETVFVGVRRCLQITEEMF